MKAALARLLMFLMVANKLSEFGRNFVDAGLGAGFVLVAAWRARNADGADRVLAHHDRQGTLRSHEIG